jgi:putative aldouronate transport system permease protein
MYGVVVAFKNYSPTRSIMDSAWVGFKYFDRFFSSPFFMQTLKNTLLLSVYTLAVTIPIPILFALMLNQFKLIRYKKFVQTVIYAPNFISVIIIVGMMTIFLSPHNGMINVLIGMFGFKPVSFMGETKWFRALFIISEVWQKTGFNAVVYLAALAGVSPELHEAAVMDGANKLQRIKYIDVPSIMPTVIIMVILAIGSLMNVGGDKAYLMKNDLNAEVARTIFVHVTDMGIERAQWSYATAVGLFNSIVNLILLFIANLLSKKATETSLF